MKNRKLLLTLLAIVVVTCMLFVAACDTHTHEFGEWTLTSNPTETAVGSATRTCSCGEVETIEVPVLTDSSVWTVSTIPSTHESAGSNVYTSVYGTVTVAIPQGQHAYTSFDSWKNGVKPTEEAGATAIMKCECGATHEESISALTDSSVWTVTTTPATHESAGKKVYNNAVYGEIEVAIAKIEHSFASFDSWKNDVKPTEEAGAIAIMKCECGATEEVSVPALLDTSVWALSTTEATHFVAGAKVYSNAVYGSISVEIPVIAHTFAFQSWKDDKEPTLTEGATANVKCECGYEKEVEVSALNDSTVWTKVDAECTVADYNTPGYDVYSSTEYGKVTIVASAKLVAAYDGKTYQVAKYFYHDSFSTNYNGSANVLVVGESVAVDTIDKSGSSYSNQKWTFTLDDATKPYGSFKAVLTWTVTSNGEGWGESATTEEKSVTYIGTVDANGYMVISSQDFETQPNNYSCGWVLVPSETAMAGSAFHTCYSWNANASKVIGVEIGEGRYNIYATDNGIYLGVSIVDFDGVAINAESITGRNSESETIAKVSYVEIKDAEGNKIAAFAKNGEYLAVADGIEGKYTNESVELSIYGNGNFAMGENSGIYTIREDKKLDCYKVVDGKNVEYFVVTLGEGTYSVERPMATITFNVGEHGTAIEPISANINVAYGLPRAEATDGTIFSGWYYDSAFERAVEAEFVPTQDVTLYALFVKINITITGAKSGDATTISVGVGDKLIDKLPAYTSATTNDAGTQLFRGWFVGEGESITAVDDNFVITIEDAEGGEVWAKWVDIVTLTLDYNSAKTNVTAQYGTGDAIDLTSFVPSVDGYAFIGWYQEAEWTNEFVATTIEANTTVYAKILVSATPFYGTTKGASFGFSYSTSSGTMSSCYSYDSYSITVDVNGILSSTFGGYTTYSCPITFSNEAKTEFTFTASTTNYVGYYDPATKLIAITSNGKLNYVYAYGADSITAEKISGNYQGSHSNAQKIIMMNLVVTKDEVSTTIPCFFYYGKMYTNVSFTDGSGNAVTNMRLLNSIPTALNVYQGETLVMSLVKKDYSNMVEPDGLEGTYTCEGRDSLVIDGKGTLTIGSSTTSIAYTITDKENNVIEYTSSSEYVVVTLNKDAKTYTYELPQILISFAMEGHGEQEEPISVNKNITYKTALPQPVEEGYYFDGWYTTRTENEGVVSYSNKISTYSGVTTTADITLYANWLKVVTISFTSEFGEAPASFTKHTGEWIYPNDYKIADTDEKLFNGWAIAGATASSMKVGTEDIQLVAVWADPVTLTIVYGNGMDNATYRFIPGATLTMSTYVPAMTNNKTFESWCSDAELTTAFEATTISEDTTVYAKWMTPYASFGAYTGSEVYYDNKSGSITGTSNYITIAADGTVTGKESGSLDASLAETKDFAVVINDRYFYVNATAGLAWTGYTKSATTVKNDVYIGYDHTRISKVEYAASSYDSSSKYYMFLKITYKDDSIAYAFCYNEIIYANVSWGDLTPVEAKSAASVVIYDSEGNGIVKKTGTTFTGCDEYAGTYTLAGSDSLVLDGFAKATIGAKVGSYVTDGNTIGIYFDNNTEYQEATIDKEAHTYTIVKPMVNVTYNYNGHGTEDEDGIVTVSVNKNIAVTLAVPSADANNTFIGWYDNAEFTGNAVETLAPSQDVQLYAKWLEKVTLTYNFNDGGTHANKVVDLYVGASYGTLEAVDFTYGTKVFVGWFTKDGTDSDWGDAVSATTTLSTSTTIYAKWIEPAAQMGTYIGWNMYGNYAGTKAKSELSTTALTVDAVGKYTSSRSGSGTLSETDQTVTDGAISTGRYTYFNKEYGIVWFGWSSSTTSVGSDTIIGFDSSRISSVEYACKVISSHLVAFLTITYSDSTTVNVLCYNDVLYTNVNWGALDCKTVRDSTDTISITKGGVEIFSKTGDTFTAAN